VLLLWLFICCAFFLQLLLYIRWIMYKYVAFDYAFMSTNYKLLFKFCILRQQQQLNKHRLNVSHCSLLHQTSLHSHWDHYKAMLLGYNGLNCNTGTRLRGTLMLCSHNNKDTAINTHTVVVQQNITTTNANIDRCLVEVTTWSTYMSKSKWIYRAPQYATSRSDVQ